MKHLCLAYEEEDPARGSRAVLQELRRTIKAAAPGAEEGISYRIPVYKYHGPLVFFAANRNEPYQRIHRDNNNRRKYIMATLNPYLNFAGSTEEAFTFYRSVFGGDFTTLLRFKDTPEASKIPEKEKNMLMHISLPVWKGNSLMATDAVESMGHKLTVGNNIQLSLEAESKDEAERLFKGLSAGGKVTVPLQDTFWGAYFGMLTDKFGIQWMVNYTHKK